MVMNQDYDLARPLQSALKAKAPYVGVPIPGHAPLIFQRDKLVRALKGVKPIHMYVEVYENGERALIVDGVAGPRCRTHLKAMSIPRLHFRIAGYHAANAMSKWRDGYKPKPAATRDPLAKYRKELERLDKALAKLGSRPELWNPAVATGPSYEADSPQRELWRDWRAQKKLRGQVGRIGHQWLRTRAVNQRLFGDEKLASRKLYDELRKIAGDIQKFSDFTPREREKAGLDSLETYADPKRLWKYCNGITKCGWHGRPWTGRDDSDTSEYAQEHPRWGAKRYASVLEWIRERRELTDRIAAVKVMMEDAAAKHAGRC